MAPTAPVLAALWSVHDRPWFLTGDWASIDLRVREVGTLQTPLIGAYSTRGWAHPGPVIYWLAAPVQWLVGGDARGYFVTAAIVNIVAMVAITWVVQRRQGPAMSLAVGLVLTVLVHGLRPNRVMDIWNPLLPLFPLLAVAFFAWSAVTGHRRHAVAAIIVGALIAQAHVSLLPVLMVIGIWSVAWWWATRRSHPRADQTPDRWSRILAIGGLGAVLVWLPPLIDQTAGTGNLGRLSDYFTGGHAQPVGLGRGAELVARFVRPDGPWIRGSLPLRFLSAVGSRPLFVVVLLLVLIAITVALYRTRDRVAAAGTSLAGALVLGAVPIASRLDEPVFDYLVRWIEVLGAFAWFWVAWGAWRLIGPHLPAPRRRLVFPLVGLVAVAVSLFTVVGASDFKLQGQDEAPAVDAIRHQLEHKISRTRLIRVEHRGDDLGNVMSGVVYWMRRDGYQVVTSDGAEGLKYGPDARWAPGDTPHTTVYTVAVDYPHRLRSAGDACARDRAVHRVARYDRLDPNQRESLEALTTKRFFTPSALTTSERRLIRRLSKGDFRVTVYVGAHVCGDGA